MTSIVMYHYVRNVVKKFKYLNILSIQNFQKQIDTLIDKYQIINPKNFLNTHKINLNDCLLTFDDGYKDHYENVFPLLKKKKIKAIFFVCSMPIIEKKVLDVNKIQFILSKIKNRQEIIDKIHNLMADFSVNPNLLTKNKIKKNRYDKFETAVIKNLLQKDIPLDKRKKIIDILFNKYVTNDENDFSENLYMSKEEILELQDYGMIIGNHTHNHYWLEQLNYKDQKKEILSCTKHFKDIGITNNSFMGYPYGSYNLDTIKILKELGFFCGFNTIPNAMKNFKNLFEIPRLDTNDF